MNNKKVNIDILNLNFLLSFNYKNIDDINQICHLCKKKIMLPNNNNNNIINLDLNYKISEGKCKHLFHTVCIDKYIKLNNNICPIDNNLWELDHILDNNNIYKKLVVNNIDIKNPSVVFKSK